MIKKFEEFVNEGLIGNLYGRASGTKQRKEDKSNIEQLKPIDLGSDFPFMFADTDFEKSGDNKFTWEETEKLIPHFEKYGWRLLTYDEVQKYFYGGNQPPRPTKNFTIEWVPEDHASIISVENGETVYFNIENKYVENYWCGLIENDKKIITQHQNSRGFEVGDPKDYYGCLIRTNNFNKKELCKIRLIKDK